MLLRAENIIGVPAEAFRVASRHGQTGQECDAAACQGSVPYGFRVRFPGFAWGWRVSFAGDEQSAAVAGVRAGHECGEVPARLDAQASVSFGLVIRMPVMR